MTPTRFESRVLSALAPYPVLRSASGVASSLYPLTIAYRYYGTIGRALRRLADRGLVSHTSCADQSVSWRGWYCTDKGRTCLCQ